MSRGSVTQKLLFYIYWMKYPYPVCSGLQIHILKTVYLESQFVIDDQQSANYLFIYLYPISSTFFWWCFRPSSGALDCIYSFWYSPPTLLPAGIMDEMELKFHLVHDTGRQQHRWTTSEAVNTIKCSRWWAKTSPETCRADGVQIKNQKFHLDGYQLRIILKMNGHTNIKS